jgi:2-isopropylmalate synthase
VKKGTEVEVLDTTLRDGSQQEGLSLSVNDKLKVAEQLDKLGVTYVEGGWPGANPKDEEFFERAKQELKFKNSKLVAFGSTRRPHSKVTEDKVTSDLLNSDTSVVCLVAKSWDMHVTDALQTTLEEALLMVKDSVEYFVKNGRKVLLDAEHFFDGYKANRDFAIKVLDTAASYGADTLVLCDTNGGTLPSELESIVKEVSSRFDKIGIHCHNDSGCAVANTVYAVIAGARHVQGCVNGYGERTGNADLTSVIPNLTLKLGYTTIPKEKIQLLTPVSHHIAELMNVTLSPQQPYVGTAAFAHKAGLHTSAIVKRSDAYEHIPPAKVGNGTRFLVSEVSGRATFKAKADEFGIEMSSEALAKVANELKKRENSGYHYEAADGSFELLMRAISGENLDFFKVESFRVVADWKSSAGKAREGDLTTEATVKVHIKDKRIIATAEGNGPVNALDAALRQAIEPSFKSLKSLFLTDFRVRVIDSSSGTKAITRVLIDTSDGNKTWSTIGVSQNIIEASWQALMDAVIYGLLQQSLKKNLNKLK